jgi:hypothetical protein
MVIKQVANLSSESESKGKRVLLPSRRAFIHNSSRGSVGCEREEYFTLERPMTVKPGFCRLYCSRRGCRIERTGTVSSEIKDSWVLSRK